MLHESRVFFFAKAGILPTDGFASALPHGGRGQAALPKP